MSSIPTRPKVVRTKEELVVFDHLTLGLRATAALKYNEAVVHFCTGLNLARACDPPKFVADSFCQLGQLFLQWKRYDKAVKIFDQAITTALPKDPHPHPAIYYGYKSAALLDNGQATEALECAEMAIKLYPTEEPGYLVKSEVLMDLKRFDELSRFVAVTAKACPAAYLDLAVSLNVVNMARFM